MKQFFAVIFLVSASASAQPVITGTTNNPVAGDKFIFHLCDTAGVTPGPAGAGVTWDFSALHNTSNATISFVACAPTPYCDSFAGANLANDMLGGDYAYLKTSAAGIDNLGEKGPGGHMIYSKPYRSLSYPLNYNTLTFDTSVYATGDAPLDTLYYKQFTNTDSNICDAYGTVILPTGTWNNVLRVRTLTTVFDSGWHFPANQVWEKIETVYYYAVGFHYPLVELIYIREPAPYRLHQVWYATLGTSGVPQQIQHNPDLSVNPNPANETAHIHFITRDAGHTSLVLTSLAGRVVYTVAASVIKDGVNEIEVPLASLPAGIYLCKVQSPDAINTCKVVVLR